MTLLFQIAAWTYIGFVALAVVGIVAHHAGRPRHVKYPVRRLEERQARSLAAAARELVDGP